MARSIRTLGAFLTLWPLLAASGAAGSDLAVGAAAPEIPKKARAE